MKKITGQLFRALSLLIFCNITAFSQGISFTANVTEGCAPLVVTYTNTSTNQNAYYYYWYFYDGSPTLAETLSTTVTHTFTNPGNYSVSVYVYDNAWNPIGGYTYATTGNTVVNGLSSFYMSTDTVCKNESVSFQPYGQLNSCSWDFGDGVTSNNQYTNHSYSGFGTFNVTLTANTTCGIKSVVQPIVVDNSQYPEANFGFDPNPACPGQVINFYTYSVHPTYTYAWNFGEPSSGPANSSILQSPQHTYSTLSKHPVTLIASNTCGKTKTSIDTILIKNNIEFPGGIDVVAANSPICPNEAVNIQIYGANGYSKYKWNFGDGSPIDSLSGQWTNHAFSSIGTHNFSCKVSNPCGTDSTFWGSVVVNNSVRFPNQNPLNLQVNSSPACPNSNIGFNAPYGYNHYEWNFGDGSGQVTTNDSWSNHTYGSALTTYTVSVKIRNSCGNDTTIFSSVQISNTNSGPGFPNGINLNAWPNPTCPNQQVNIQLYNANGYPKYKWNFNDGSPVDSISGQWVNHSFSSIGTHNFSCKITNQCGKDSTFWGSVVVNNSVRFSNQNPLNLQVNSSPSCPNSSVNFNAPGGYQKYKWNFGDNSPIDSTTNSWFNHNYGSAITTYTVSVKITNACGNDTTIYSTLQISNTGSAANFPNGINLNAGPNPTCPNSQIHLQVNNAFGYPKYKWNFGDNTPIDSISGYSVNHAFTSIGTKNFSCKITDHCGKDSTFWGSVTVSNNAPFPNYPGFNLQVYSSPSCPNSSVGFNAPNGYTKYKWNFGDNSALDSTTDNWNNHTYGSALSTYTVSVKITSACGNDTTLYGTINISNTGSAANFPNGINLEAGPNPTCPNQFVNLRVNGNNTNNYLKYKWNFGDNSPNDSISGYNVNHAFGSIGTHNFSCKVTNHCGKDSTFFGSVTVSNNAPFPNYPDFRVQVNPSPSCPNSTVNFNAPQGYNKYKWNFGDGSPNDSTTDNWINHTYGSGITTYTVSAKITNACGNDTIIYGTVKIENNAPFPHQSFHLDINSPACPNNSVSMNAPQGYSSYQWNFGDNSPLLTTSESWGNHTYGSALTTYTVSVKITNTCGNDTILYGTIRIANNAGFSTQSNFKIEGGEAPSCPNSTIRFNAPYGYSSYEWNFGDQSPHLTTNSNEYNHTYGSAITTYTVSVKIKNGCGDSITLFTTVQIINNAGFPHNSGFKIDGSPNPACPTDQVNFNVQGSYVNYKWKFGDGDSAYSSQGHANHAYILAATYTVSVIITNACGNDTTLYTTVNVNGSGSFSNSLRIDKTPATSACSNDLINFRVNQKDFTSYFWDFGDGDTVTTTGENIQHAFDTLGTYTVSCRVTNGCGNTMVINTTVEVTNNNPITSSLLITGMPNPSCPNDEVFFNVNQGQSSFTFIWNYGDGSPVDTTIGAGAHHFYDSIGTYIVTTTVINGCGSSKTFTTTETISNTNSPVLTDAQGNKIWGFPGGENGGNNTAGCANDAIIFFFQGSSENNVWDFGDGNTGTATEHMIVSGGDKGPMAVTIIKHAFSTVGDYMVKFTLTNDCGNSVTDSTLVHIGGNQVVNGDISTSPPPYTTCAPIDFIAFGGATYEWDFGDGSTLNTTSPTVSHTFSTQDNYAVNVKVINGCGNSATYSTSVNVNGVGGPAILITSTTNPTCISGSNGSASLSVSSGEPPYSYSWDDANAQTTETATGLAAGIYSATVTDNIGCSKAIDVTISDPAPIVLNTITTNAGCGTSTGTATVSVTSGGTAPFTYHWSTGSTNSSLTGLATGSYSVVATDFHGCTSHSNISISENGGATLSINTLTNISCYGGSNGAIDISITGGTPPYTYAWSNGSTNQDITGLFAGNYSVMATDVGGCKATINATVIQPNVLSVITSIDQSPSCGNFDGIASANPSGGTAPYTYLWDDNTGNQTTAIATDLPAGTDSVLITDSKGCKTGGEVSLSNSNSPNITAIVTDVTCNGGSNGAINLTVTGGTSPYSYSWNVSPPQTNHKNITGLISGNYFVSVNDRMGCTSFHSYTVSQPALAALTSAGIATICSGGSVSIPFTSNINSTYTWIAGNNPNTTGESTTIQTTGTLSNTIINSTSSVETVTYTVTPTAVTGSCVGTPQTVTVTVNPLPTMTSASSSTICSGGSVSIPLTSSVASTYTWIASDNVNITGESTTAQTTGTLSNVLTNTSSVVQTVTYIVTPTSIVGTCGGTPQTITVTVNPTPTMTNASSATICGGSMVSIPLGSDISATYTWIAADNANTTGESTSSQTTGIINDVLLNTTTSTQTVTYAVTPISSLGTCTGAVQTIQVTVNPLPTITNASSETLCSGTTLAIPLTSNIGASYTWLATDNLNVTGESTTTQATGTLGNVLTNTSTMVQTVTYTVTPTSIGGLCAGGQQVVTVTVNPVPVMTSTNTSTICSGNSANVSLTSSVSSTYSWIASDNVNTTGETTTAQATGIINDMLTNTATTAQTVLYTVTPTSIIGSCLGLSQTVNVLVNPLPVVNSSGLAAIYCFNAPAQNLSGTPVGGTFSGNGISGTSFTASVADSGQHTITYTYTDGNSCTNSSSQTTQVLPRPAAPPICMVTVDTNSTHNIIYWEKPVLTDIDSFKIYREVTTNVFDQIASVAYDSLSEYHDNAANPNVTSYKYKLAVLDSCGNTSDLGDYHNTIHLQNLGGGNLQWTLYEIENAGNPVTYYRVYRDDLGTGNFLPISSTIPGGNSTYTDLNYSSYPNANYRVDVAWSISCSPTRQLISTTRSNIKHQNVIVTGIANTDESTMNIAIYPNPANENITIELFPSGQSGNQQAKIKIFNALGQLMEDEIVMLRSSSKAFKYINVSAYAKGIYTISIENNGIMRYKKLIVD